MSATRLSLALDGGLLELPSEGMIGVYNPSSDFFIPGFDLDRIQAVQSFYPEMAILRSRGIDVHPEPEGGVAASIVFCHRARARSFDLLAKAVDLTQPGGIIVLEGAKTDGVESILKDLRKRFAEVEVYAKSHGKLAWFRRPETAPDLTSWRATAKSVDGFVTYPGVFSSDKVDKGSALLIHHMDPISGSVVDLGAGWGYLSRHILGNPDVSHLDMVEAEYHAVQAARNNITDPRAEAHWADVTKWTGRSYDAVVMNPPFHVSRKADADLGLAFIRTAARLLKPRGQLWMVANRNLPYEKSLDDSFGEVRTVIQSDGFKVIHARKPKQTGASRR